MLIFSDGVLLKLNLRIWVEKNIYTFFFFLNIWECHYLESWDFLYNTLSPLSLPLRLMAAAAVQSKVSLECPSLKKNLCYS